MQPAADQFLSRQLSLTRIIFCVSLLLLTGCSNIPGIKEVADSQRPGLHAENTGSFAARPDIPTPTELHRLTDSQKRDFLAHMNNPALATLKPNLRMYRYLERQTDYFAYEDKTYNASQTLTLNSGNCMALAILTTALADLAGLEIDYQLMDDAPVYEFNGVDVKKGVHIRSRIYDPEFVNVEGTFMLTRPGINVDYFPTNRMRFISNLGRDEYLAMVYQNLAVEALDKNAFNDTYWLAMESLRYDPDYAAAINTLAVVNRRAGNVDVAEFIYQYGITHARDKLTLMKNYQIMLESSGRQREAENIKQRLETMPDPSPFHWYQVAKAAYEKGEYQEAIRYYNKALDLAPYLHEAFLGIAQANYKLGRLPGTRHALESALQEAQKVSMRNLYEAKLLALSLEMQH